MTELNKYWQVTQKHKIRFLTFEGEGVIQLNLLRLKAKCSECGNLLVVNNTEVDGPSIVCPNGVTHEHNFVIDPNEYEKPIVREKK